MFDFLKGVTVIELGHILLGPQAGQSLGDFGATVIKIEPLTGDIYRNVGIKRNPRMSAQWLNCNRNKQSIALDLKTEDGRAVLRRLVETADVFLHNMRPNAVARLGFDYASASKLNPKLVYCFSAGFGQSGPYADYPAFDDVIQAYSGIAHLNGVNTDEPKMLPVAITDHVTSMALVQAILAGLFKREREQKGSCIEVPMMETIVSIVMNQHLSGHCYEPPAGPIGYPRMLSKGRRPCQTTDGYIVHGVYTLAHWQRFLPAVQREDILNSGILDDPNELAANISDLYETLAEEIIPKKSTRDWLDLFERLDIPCAPVIQVQDLLEDQHLQSVGLFREYEHPHEGPLRDIRPPFVVQGANTSEDIPPPLIGQDSEAVLQALGIGDTEIARLIETKVVGTP